MPIDKERYSPNLDNGRQGWVYLLTHAAMPGLVKVGATRKHPLQRARELSAGTGVPGDFQIAYYHDYVDCFAAETAVHQRFEAVRVTTAREFFEVGVDEVIGFLDTLDIASEGLAGGDWRAPATLPATPWADLFASFPDDGSPRELTADERAKCRALAASLS